MGFLKWLMKLKAKFTSDAEDERRDEFLRFVRAEKKAEWTAMKEAEEAVLRAEEAAAEAGDAEEKKVFIKRRMELEAKFTSNAERIWVDDMVLETLKAIMEAEIAALKEAEEAAIEAALLCANEELDEDEDFVAVDIPDAARDSVLEELEVCARRAESISSKDKMASLLMRIVILAGYLALIIGGLAFVVCDSSFVPWLVVGMSLPGAGALGMATVHYFMARSEQELIKRVRRLIAKNGIKAKIVLSQEAFRASWKGFFLCGRMPPNLFTFLLNHIIWSDKHAFGAHLLNVVAGCCIFMANAFIEENSATVREGEETPRIGCCRGPKLAVLFGEGAALLSIGSSLYTVAIGVTRMCNGLEDESETARSIRQLAAAIKMKCEDIPSLIIYSNF